MPFPVFALLVAAIALLGAAPSPKPTTSPAPVPLPAGISASDAASITAAIDARLADGLGRLCVGGPPEFPATVYADDSDGALRARVSRLLAVGFIRVVRTENVDGVAATVYDLTNAGRRAFTTFRQPGFRTEDHGWCFAQFRVARIVGIDAGAFCPGSLGAHRGALQATATGTCAVSVTYTPRIIAREPWANEPQAKTFPEVAGLNDFDEQARTMLVEFDGVEWNAPPDDANS